MELIGTRDVLNVTMLTLDTRSRSLKQISVFAYPQGVLHDQSQCHQAFKHGAFGGSLAFKLAGSPTGQQRQARLWQP